MTSSEYVKNIVSKINDIKDDNVYLLIFNFLSKNDTVKNYSYNSNGIFFNLNKMDLNVIVGLSNLVESCNLIKEENKKLEEQRNSDILEMKKSIKNFTSQELNLYISTKRSSYSTILDDTTDDDNIIYGGESSGDDNFCDLDAYDDDNKSESHLDDPIDYERDDYGCGDDKELFGEWSDED
jgi:hypothetical protein